MKIPYPSDHLDTVSPDHATFQHPSDIIKGFRESFKESSAKVASVNIDPIAYSAMFHRTEIPRGPFLVASAIESRAIVELKLRHPTSIASSASGPIFFTHLLVVEELVYPCQALLLAAVSPVMARLFVERTKDTPAMRSISNGFHRDDTLNSLVLEVPVIPLNDVQIDAEAFDILLRFITLDKCNELLRHLLYRHEERWGSYKVASSQNALEKHQFPTREQLEAVCQYNSLIVEGIWEEENAIWSAPHCMDEFDLPQHEYNRGYAKTWSEEHQAIDYPCCTSPYSGYASSEPSSASEEDAAPQQHSGLEDLLLAADRIHRVHALAEALELDSKNSVWDMLKLAWSIVDDRIVMYRRMK